MGGSKGKLALYKGAPTKKLGKQQEPMHFSRDLCKGTLVGFSFLFETCLMKFARGFR